MQVIDFVANLINEGIYRPGLKSGMLIALNHGGISVKING